MAILEINVGGVELVDEEGTILGETDYDLRAGVRWQNGDPVIVDVWHRHAGTIQRTERGKIIAAWIHERYSGEKGLSDLRDLCEDAMERERDRAA